MFPSVCVCILYRQVFWFTINFGGICGSSAAPRTPFAATPGGSYVQTARISRFPTVLTCHKAVLPTQWETKSESELASSHNTVGNAIDSFGITFVDRVLNKTYRVLGPTLKTSSLLLTKSRIRTKRIVSWESSSKNKQFFISNRQFFIQRRVGHGEKPFLAKVWLAENGCCLGRLSGFLSG